MSEEAKKQKQVIIDEIKGKLDGAKSAVLVDYMGITVEQAEILRKKLREYETEGGSILIWLARTAIKYYQDKRNNELNE